MFKEKKVQNFHSIFEQAMLLKIHFVQNLNFYYVQEIAGENPSFVKVYFFSFVNRKYIFFLWESTVKLPFILVAYIRYVRKKGSGTM